MTIDRASLIAAGLDAERVNACIQAVAESRKRSTDMSSDADRVEVLSTEGWALLDSLPLRSKRNDVEKRAASILLGAICDGCEAFCRTHRKELYRTLTRDLSTSLRADDVVFRAAELWPGLVPTRNELATEAKRMQMDKDGRELQQGLFLSQILSGADTGGHLIQSMLAPTEEAVSLLEELIARGSVDLGTARVEVRDRVGYVYFTHPRYLNAEDDETRGPQETAVDLILLHPEVRMGVLRGDPVTHPKYAGRRIFSAGINLTRIYHGQVSYLFYILRDLGLVHKLYRGLAGSSWQPDEPEQTVEKPWMAVVEGFAIGGGCQLLLVMDYVIAEAGSYFNLPARKEGIIPGAANLRLPRFMGEGLARDAILFDRKFPVEAPESRALVNEVHPRDKLDDAIAQAVSNAVDSGMVSASGNRKAMRVQTEPLDVFRRYMATYAREQAFCHLSEQLVQNLERHWNAKTRRV